VAKTCDSEKRRISKDVGPLGAISEKWLAFGPEIEVLADTRSPSHHADFEAN
jgi:hypothetical protein